MKTTGELKQLSCLTLKSRQPVTLICKTSLESSCFDSLGFRQLCGLNNSNVLSHSPGSYRAQIKAGLAPCEGTERDPAPCLSDSFWWLADNLWYSFAWRSVILISAFSFTQCSSCVSPNFPIL